MEDQSDIERLADLKMSNPLFVRARRQDETSSGTADTRAVKMVEEDFWLRKHSRSFRQAARPQLAVSFATPQARRECQSGTSSEESSSDRDAMSEPGRPGSLI